MRLPGAGRCDGLLLDGQRGGSPCASVMFARNQFLQHNHQLVKSWALVGVREQTLLAYGLQSSGDVMISPQPYAIANILLKVPPSCFKLTREPVK